MSKHKSHEECQVNLQPLYTPPVTGKDTFEHLDNWEYCDVCNIAYHIDKDGYILPEPDHDCYELSDESGNCQYPGCRYVPTDKPQMSQSEALAFAKKYLEDRLYGLVKNDDYTHILDLAIEYVTNDIIPHLYGEALD